MHLLDLIGWAAIAGLCLAIVGLCIGLASVMWREKHPTPQCTPSRGEVLTTPSQVDIVIAQLERQFTEEM